MNWHEVIDQRSLDLHRVVARDLRADPAKLDLVIAWIERFVDNPEYSPHARDSLTEWVAIIHQGLSKVLDVLEDDSEEGQRLRQSSPFAVIIPPEERARIFSRYEALRPRAYPAGV